MLTQSPKTETSAASKKRQEQPRHHAPKSKQAAALRRKQIIHAITEGKTHKEAGIMAGLSPVSAGEQVSQILQEPSTQLTFREAMARIGLNDEYIAEKHLELLEGKKYIPLRGDMEESESVRGYAEIPDLQAIAKGLDIVHKLAGRYTEQHEINVKPPINVIIKKFCSRRTPDGTGASEEKAA